MLYVRHLISEHLQLIYTTVTITTLPQLMSFHEKQTNKNTFSGPDAMLRQ